MFCNVRVWFNVGGVVFSAVSAGWMDLAKTTGWLSVRFGGRMGTEPREKPLWCGFQNVNLRGELGLGRGPHCYCY